MANVPSRRLSYHLGRKGQLNFPGITSASKQIAEELLLKDAEEHHCFFRSAGLHNHLSHHILAAYDLGAPAGLLAKIYESEGRIQRPIYLDEKDRHIVVDNKNWVQYLGNQNAYSAFVEFFSQEIATNGVASTLEKYIFDEEANADGRYMLTRVVSGAVHPFIQIGYGAEFRIDTLFATGLAQACMHNPIQGTVFNIDKSPQHNITLLELLRRVYDSPILKPIPYNPNMLLSERIRRALANGGAEELQRLCALYHISEHITDVDLDKKIKECTFVATLLMSGTGRRGRKPRLDFFLMHLVTSSIFLKPLCAALRNSEHKAALLRAYVPVMMVYVLARGRPRIDPELIMSYSESPRSPITAQKEYFKSTNQATGNPWNDEDYNPWPTLIEGCLYHSDSHVLKAMRTLVLGASQYGDTPPGQVPGSLNGEGKETHAGIGKVDGTLFVRAAGIMMDTLGWSGHGQQEGEWDSSALGWDAAWE